MLGDPEGGGTVEPEGGRDGGKESEDLPKQGREEKEGILTWVPQRARRCSLGKTRGRPQSIGSRSAALPGGRQLRRREAGREKREEKNK